MKIKSVLDPEFSAYGKVVTGYDFASLLQTLNSTTEKPADSVIYVPSDKTLEEQPVFEELSNAFYGGMPIQLGYCNGSNVKLDCLEYHRDSELNIVADEMVFLVAPLQKVLHGVIDTSEVEAFSAPAGTAVQLYETTLHYAPCNAPGKNGFRVAVVLPRGTNTEKPSLPIRNGEDKLLWARNKWLIAHPDSKEAKLGAFIGLTGENITLE